MNVDTTGTNYNVKKFNAFIVKRLRQVLYDIRPLKSNLAKNLTLPNVSLIAT